jgi:hypothetical protein
LQQYLEVVDGAVAGVYYRSRQVSPAVAIEVARY